MRLRTLLLALALAAAAPACRRAETPAERYQRFALAARTGRADLVWAMLSERSRATLDARARELAAAAPAGVVAPSGQELVLGDLFSRAPRVKSVVVVRESAGAAVVAVEDEAGGRGEVTLVNEGGEWRVELPGGRG